VPPAECVPRDASSSTRRAVRLFRRVLSISQGDASLFFTQPISATFLAVTAALVVGPWAVRRRRRR